MKRRFSAWFTALAAAVVGCTGLAVLAPAQAAVSTSNWFVVTSRHSGMALDISERSAADGADLLQYTRSDATNQQFRFVSAGSGHYYLQVRHSGKVLGLQNDSTADGAYVEQETNTGGTDQQWSVQVSGGYTAFINRASGKALDLWEWSTAPGSRISQDTASGDAVQQWQLHDVDCVDGQSTPSLSGDLTAHDPSLYAGCEDESWYVFSTGDGDVGDGNVQIRSSSDGNSWSYTDTVWDSKPSWITSSISGVGSIWAPEVYYDSTQGTYYLYYAASTLGSQNSLIALATNTTLDPDNPDYEWVDEGVVLQTYSGDDYNAIDPYIIADNYGTHWMVFGSWWNGIYAQQLDWPSGKPASGASPVRLAAKSGGIEGASMVYHDGYYYLFTSIGACCAGASSTYQITVGRSTSVTGPFTDASGTALTSGGGTVLLGAYGEFVASGGQSVHRGLMVYHSYHEDGHHEFNIESVDWSNGWPVLTGA